jgi:hypothetical protein
MGASACVFLMLLALALGWYSRPAATTSAASVWNTSAIEATLATVRVTEVDPMHAAVLFLYDMDNRTNTDYHLIKGPNVVIMSRLKATDSLGADQPADIESSAFLPAGNRARVAVQVVQPFAWPSQKDAAAERSFRDLVANQIVGLRGFVLFDEAARYQIELPVDLPELQPLTAAKPQ